MGVEFYGCSVCGESRYEEYVGWCTCCNNSICTNCVTNDDVGSNYASHYGVRFDGTEEQREKYGFDEGDYEEGDLIDDTSIDPKYCPYCQNEQINEGELLNFAIKLSGINREELERMFLENKLN